MDETAKRKLYATAKVTYGVGRGVSAVLMGTGHGLLGALNKKHHMMGQAHAIAAKGIKEAEKTIKEGMRTGRVQNMTDGRRASAFFAWFPDRSGQRGIRAVKYMSLSRPAA